MLKICQLNNIFDKFMCIFIHGYVVYFSVYMNNGLFSLKTIKDTEYLAKGKIVK